MERALRLLLQWGSASVEDGGRALETVIWWANEGNWGSRRLAWRVGFDIAPGVVRQWLPHRGELRDAWVGSLCRGEPLQPRRPGLEVPRIVGEGVVLRRHRDDDVERVRGACSDERSVYWLGRLPAPYTRADAERFVLLREEGMAVGTDVHWVVADPTDDRLLGAVSLMRIGEGGAEIGYWMHPEGRGRGLMTEAVRLAVRHAFIDVEDGGLGLVRVHLEAAVDNAASRHVAEAAGLTLQTVLPRAIMVRDGLHDSARYGALRA
jgi:RimJ/RimL family protein N-acetyltransferase